MTEDQNADIKQMDYEQAIAELESIVDQLESTTLPLAQVLILHQRGYALAQRCQTLLADVELQIQKLVTDADGGQTTVPLDLTAER